MTSARPVVLEGVVPGLFLYLRHLPTRGSLGVPTFYAGIGPDLTTGPPSTPK